MSSHRVILGLHPNVSMSQMAPGYRARQVMERSERDGCNTEGGGGDWGKRSVHGQSKGSKLSIPIAAKQDYLTSGN